jgi:hypothetical protein
VSCGQDHLRHAGGAQTRDLDGPPADERHVRPGDVARPTAFDEHPLTAPGDLTADWDTIDHHAVADPNRHLLGNPRHRRAGVDGNPWLRHGGGRQSNQREHRRAERKSSRHDSQLWMLVALMLVCVLIGVVLHIVLSRRRSARRHARSS